MNNKYYQIMILHALGDTIGFRNGLWEFNYFDVNNNRSLDFINEMIYDYIDLGGINGIDITNWNISDDTYFHIATAKSLCEYDEKNDNYIEIVANILIDEYDKMKKSKINRYIGINTEKKIQNLKNKNNDLYDVIIDNNALGNGSCMRVPIIGACVRDNNKLYSIISENVKPTHYNISSILSSYIIAKFIDYGIRKIDIEKWVPKIIDKLKNIKKRHISNNSSDVSYDRIYNDINDVINVWKKYLDTKFVDNIPLKIRSFSNPLYRVKYYHDTFFKNDNYSTDKNSIIGSSAYLSVIIAYDCLLDCDGKYEKLIYYSMLNNMDTDTIGAMASSLYASYYGFGDCPLRLLENIERKKDIIDISLNLEKKYGKI